MPVSDESFISDLIENEKEKTIYDKFATRIPGIIHKLAPKWYSICYVNQLLLSKLHH